MQIMELMQAKFIKRQMENGIGLFIKTAAQEIKLPLTECVVPDVTSVAV